MVEILNTAFAAAAVVCLWGAFIGAVLRLLGKIEKHSTLWRVTCASFYAFLVFFIAWGIMRNLAMPSWNR